jgi:hypothetical protein
MIRRTKKNKMKQDQSPVFTELSEASKFDWSFEVNIFSLHRSFSDDIRTPKGMFSFLSKIQAIDLLTKAEDIPPNYSTRNSTGQYINWKLPLTDEAAS